MAGYRHVLLSDMVEQIGEGVTKNILSNFHCPINPDVEKFLKYSATEGSKQKISSTHLIFASYKNNFVLAGYYTLTLKTIFVSTKHLSRNIRQRIKKFGVQDAARKGYEIPAPLIAQLGKNYTSGYNKLITGDELLFLALQSVRSIQRNIGGKVVYIECEDKPYLSEFYSKNGFVRFGNRPLDKDERDDLSGEYLNQMLKYLGE